MQKHHLVGRLCPKGGGGGVDKKESVFEPKAKFTLKCLHVLAKFMVNNSTVLLRAPVLDPLLRLEWAMMSFL